jgi:hypothetical protein
MWKTEPTTHGLTGFQHLRDAHIAVMGATQPATLTITVDGVNYNYTIAANGGAYQKPEIDLTAIKGKWFQYMVSCAVPVRVFKTHCELRVKSWGSEGAYQVVNPFGDASRDGARI